MKVVLRYSEGHRRGDRWWGYKNSVDEAGYSVVRRVQSGQPRQGGYRCPRSGRARRATSPLRCAESRPESTPASRRADRRQGQPITSNAPPRAGRPFFTYVALSHIHPPEKAHPDFDQTDPARLGDVRGPHRGDGPPGRPDPAAHLKTIRPTFKDRDPAAIARVAGRSRSGSPPTATSSPSSLSAPTSPTLRRVLDHAGLDGPANPARDGRVTPPADRAARDRRPADRGRGRHDPRPACRPAGGCRCGCSSRPACASASCQALAWGDVDEQRRHGSGSSAGRPGRRPPLRGRCPTG